LDATVRDHRRLFLWIDLKTPLVQGVCCVRSHYLVYSGVSAAYHSPPPSSTEHDERPATDDDGSIEPCTQIGDPLGRAMIELINTKINL
jgi:hypothetical protein